MFGLSGNLFIINSLWAFYVLICCFSLVNVYVRDSTGVTYLLNISRILKCSPLMPGSKVMSSPSPQISISSFIWPFTSNPDVRSIKRRHTRDLHLETGNMC